jgi:hypothetical protein
MANKEVFYNELKEIASDLGKGTVTLIKGIGYATIPFLEWVYHYKTAKKEANTVNKGIYELWQGQATAFSFAKGAVEGGVPGSILFLRDSNYAVPVVILGISYSIISAIGTYNALRLGRRVGKSEFKSAAESDIIYNNTPVLETIVAIPSSNTKTTRKSRKK